MSRYSRIFLRPNTGNSSWTGESSSKMSTAEPASSSSPGFSYPPSSLPGSPSPLPFPMSSPAPHPYTLGASHYPEDTPSSREGTSTVSHAQQPTNTASQFSTVEKQKPPESPVGHQYPHTAIAVPTNLNLNLPARPPLPIHRRPLVLLFLFLPIPPLLSLTYMVTGHAILRATQSSSSPNTIFRSPLLSSIEAGATGGVVLALPVALLLYLLLFPLSPPTAPEDFFEDDTSSVIRGRRWVRYLGYTVSAFLLLFIGAMAAPLGVTCLSGGTLDMFVGTRKILSPGAAALAGLLGGVLVAFGLLALSVFAIVVWSFSTKQREPTF
ncbi:hypothetical protein GALMADRAFT_142539 [Galerina marginata CBS 339.88]|uniref:Uncharacterized protein n=1 Tax=Galerina marginata (strain CBS 339.88) TaxID=685588 RepID=A0A067SRX9_GALM3|nr:hypothetical protein GALMADRAFT_142539 [Galerina marginata CBS 339.88]